VSVRTCSDAQHVCQTNQPEGCCRGIKSHSPRSRRYQWPPAGGEASANAENRSFGPVDGGMVVGRLDGSPVVTVRLGILDMCASAIIVHKRCDAELERFP
jgi:hypothetical protein